MTTKEEDDNQREIRGMLEKDRAEREKRLYREDMKRYSKINFFDMDPGP